MSKQAKEFDWRRDFFGRLDKNEVESCLYNYPGFLNDESIPFNAKKAMAALLCAYENTRASETGVLCMDLDTLSRIAGMRKMNFKLSVKMLDKLGVVKYSIGEKREKGKKAGVASSFKVDFEALQTLSEQASGEAGTALHYITSNSSISQGISEEGITEDLIGKNNKVFQGISEEGITEDLIGKNNKVFQGISEESITEDLIGKNNKVFQGISEENILKDFTEIKNKLQQEKTTDDIARNNSDLQGMSLEKIKEKINEKGLGTLTEKEHMLYLKSIREREPVCAPVDFEYADDATEDDCLPF